MLIRTLRETEIAGRRTRPFACLHLPADQAAALIDAGQAEPWDPQVRATAPASPAAPVAPAADQPE